MFLRRSQRGSTQGSELPADERQPLGKPAHVLSDRYDPKAVKALIARAKDDDGAGGVDGVQYFESNGFHILQAKLQSARAQFKKRLNRGLTDDFIQLLRAVARALEHEKACHGDDVGEDYVRTYMVNTCTDVLVAFHTNEPVAFALLEKTAAATEIGMLCAAQAKGKNAGTVMMNLIKAEAQKENKTLTLSALPSVVSYYTKHGFSLGKNCEGPPVALTYGGLAGTRVQKNGDKYDYSGVAPLFAELHNKGIAVDRRNACIKGNMTFEQLEKKGCHIDGYFMYKCPDQHAAAAAPPPRSAHASPHVSPARASPRASPARASPHVSPARASPHVSPARASSSPRNSPVAPRRRGRGRAPATTAVAGPGVRGKLVPGEGLRRVSKKQLKQSNDDNDRWLRRTKDNNRLEWLSRQQLQEQENDLRRQRHLAAQYRKARRDAERTVCASAKKVMAGEDPRLRVCSGSLRYGNRVKLTRRDYERQLQQLGKCVSAEVAHADPENKKVRVCRGSRLLGNEKRFTGAEHDAKTYAYGRKCASYNDTYNQDDRGDLRYCTKRGDQSLRLTKEDLHRERAASQQERDARRKKPRAPGAGVVARSARSARGR